MLKWYRHVVRMEGNGCRERTRRVTCNNMGDGSDEGDEAE